MDANWLLDAIGKADIGLWQWDALTDRFALTDTFLKLVSDEGNSQAIDVEYALTYVHEGDRDRVRTVFEGLVESGSEFRFKWRSARSQNSTKWLESVGEVIRDSTGKVLSFQGATYDVTQLIESQSELAETHELYQKVLASAGLAVYHYDFESDEYRKANLTLLEQFFGQPYRGSHKEYWARIKVLEMQLLGELSGLTLREAIQKYQSGEADAWRSELRILRPDGKISWIYDHSTLIRDADGKAVGSFGILQDITELKLLSSSVEQIVSGTGQQNADYLMQLAVSISESLGVAHAMICELDGQERDQMRTVAFCEKGKPIANIAFPLRTSPCVKALEDDVFFQRSSLQNAYPEDSTPKTLGADSFLGVILRSNNGEPLGVMALLHDGPIDESYHPVRVLQLFASHAAAELERRYQVKSLEKSEALYRTLVNVQTEGIIVQDEFGRILTCNKSALRLLRKSEDELIGKVAANLDFALIDADGSPWNPDRSPSALASKSGIAQVDRVVGIKFQDGETTWLSVNAMPIQGAEPSTGARVVVSFADITERLETQRQMEKLNTELESVIAERTEELTRANRELESFAYSVSHDLRQPLRAIDGFSRILEMDYKDKLDDEGIENISTIRNATRRMSNLIDDLLRLSRLISHDIEMTEIDLSQLAGEVFNQLSNSLEGRDVKVSIEPGMHVKGDRNLIRAVLDNIIQNAVKFTSQNEQATIEIGKSDGAFFVKDNGVGFDMRYSNKLFEPFQRLHSPREFEGSGIGLATVRRIIERHRGKVWAEAEVGKGATVFFSLPA